MAIWRLSLVCLLCSAAATLVKQGRWTVDASGRVVVFHGLNQVNKLPPYTHDSIGFDDDDMDLIAGWGFNVIRLGITWAAIEPTPGSYNETYLASIVDTIRLLQQRNLNVLLDLHQDAYSTKHDGAGFPEWASLGVGVNNVGFPYIYFGGLTLAPGLVVNYVVDQDFDNFWANTLLADGVGIQTRFINMIGEVARVLMPEPNVIGIDVMNEPFPGSDWTRCLDPQGGFTRGCVEFESGVYSNFLQAVLGAIRPHSNKIVFWEPSSVHCIANNVPSFVRDLHDDQLGYSFHNYFPKNYTSVFAMATPNARSTSATPLLTEFGGDSNATVWSAVLPLADQYLDGWIYWTYTNNPIYHFTAIAGLPADPRTQGLVYNASAALEGSNVAVDRLKILSRPYPRATAGIPQSLVYNANAGTVTYQYTYDPCKMGSKITEIFIPNHAFPNGRTKYSRSGSAQLTSVTPLANGRVLNFRNNLPPTGKGLCGRLVSVSIKVERCSSNKGCAPGV
jgi:endoglycosylceramidase